MSKREFSINAEALAAYLREIVSKVESEEDPDEMNELKKIFKQNVPFGRRTYVAAYLAKQLSSNTRPFYRRERPSRYSRYERNTMHGDYNERSERPIREREPREMREMREPHPVESMGMKPPVSRAIIAPEFAKTVFISIGRNRRVYARDLIALISQGAGVERERIGDIKVYDNYSFITLFAEDADKVIELLNSYEYRGRKLTVSYSRKKEDDDTNEESFVPTEETSEM